MSFTVIKSIYGVDSEFSDFGEKKNEKGNIVFLLKSANQEMELGSRKNDRRFAVIPLCEYHIDIEAFLVSSRCLGL